jgi:anti-anti-sigma regulatory factor
MTRIILPARCDRAAASALLPDFVAPLGLDRLEIDASGVEQVGHAMLQLLASARASFEQFSIAPSPALREAAQLSGLAAHLLDEARP